MRGYEVTFKLLVISFKIPLKSWFSQDPLHCFPYSSSPTLWIPHIFGIYGKVFSRRILAWQLCAARTVLHGQRRHLPIHAPQHIFSIYLQLPPPLTPPPFPTSTYFP